MVLSSVDYALRPRVPVVAPVGFALIIFVGGEWSLDFILGHVILIIGILIFLACEYFLVLVRWYRLADDELHIDSMLVHNSIRYDEIGSVGRPSLSYEVRIYLKNGDRRDIVPTGFYRRKDVREFIQLLRQRVAVIGGQPA